MIPAFTQKTMRYVVELSARKAEALSDTWKDASVIEVSRGMKKITLDVLGLAMFSYDFGSVESQQSASFEAMNTLWHNLHGRFLQPQLLWPLMTSHRRAVRAKTFITGLLLETIRAKRESADVDDAVGHLDVIELLVKDQGLSQEEIIHEMFGLFVAGHETSASTLTFVFYHLLTQPYVLTRVEDELRVVMGSAEPNAALVAKLRYLDGVLKETLRLTPIVHSTTRVSSRPITHNGVLLPTGTAFSIDILGHHLDPNYFEDPMAFRPERWMDADKWLKPGTFLAFIDGPHRCIGERMAMLEMKAVIAVLVRNFRMELAEGQDFTKKWYLTGQFPAGLRIKVSRR